MSEFPSISFSGTLRPSQRDAVEIAKRKLAEGHRRLHIVAPPGSGKTILGLYLWAECVKRPALVLSPNSAIQSQWADKAEALFPTVNAGGSERHGSENGPTGASLKLTSTDPLEMGWLTSLTYQAVTLPKRGDEDLDLAATELWRESLVAREQSEDLEEAQRWIDDLKRHNPEYYADRLAVYRKQHRDQLSQMGEALPLLHASSQGVLRRLKECGIGMIVFDECHHLLGHWGRVLADAHGYLDEPVIVGLTATPPDSEGKPQVDVERYGEFFGPIDYEVPIPAVVKDGFLAPYQDLAFFVRPTPAEIDFVANVDDQFHALVNELCAERLEENHDALKNIATPLPVQVQMETPSVEQSLDQTLEKEPAKRIESLPTWLWRTLDERLHPLGVAKDWNAFEKRDPAFSLAARRFLLQRRLTLPADVPPPIEDDTVETPSDLDVFVPVIDRYVRHGLRRSGHTADRDLAEKAIRQMRLLGVQITETGCQACASPAGRVIAYSKSKMKAVPEILRVERLALGDRLRAVVVCDYEKTSAISAEVSHLLDEEAGGAMAAFRTLIAHPETHDLDAVLLTGSSVLVDSDVAEHLKTEAEAWLKREGVDVQLSLDAPPRELTSSDGHRFLILNGHGADWCPRVYVALITELFLRGVTRCLVGTRGLLGEGWDAHKINVLIDLTTVTTSMSVNQLRGRSFRLDPDDASKLANNWDVVCLAPEFSQGLEDYHRLIRKHGQIFGVTEDGVIEKGIGHVHAAFTELKPELVEGSVSVLNEEMLARARLRDSARERWKIGQPYQAEPVNTVEVRLRATETGGFPSFSGSKSPWSDASLSAAVGRSLLSALVELKLITSQTTVHVGERSGGYVRLFLENASKEDSALFAETLQEIFAPLHKPRYVIPRTVDFVKSSWFSRLLPGVIGRYFQRRETKLVMWHAVPSVFAKNKQMVAVFEKYWKQSVCPTEAVYALTGEGAEIVKIARQKGISPTGPIHVKEVFL